MDGVEQLFRDAIDIGFCQADYSTKFGEVMGELLPEMAVGASRLLSEYPAGVASEEALLDLGRRMLIRLETSSNRASLKKLPEMMFQMLKNHHYMNIQTKKLIMLNIVLLKSTLKLQLKNMINLSLNW